MTIYLLFFKKMIKYSPGGTENMEDKKKNGNDVGKDSFHNHPEIKEGEVFIGNKCMDSCKELPYLSKRLGKIALNKFGQKISKPDEIPENMLFPVFVKEEEYHRLKRKKR